MTYIVEAPAKWYLRGTAWTDSKDRAQAFFSRDEAQAALERAAQFRGLSPVKTWKVVALEYKVEMRQGDQWLFVILPNFKTAEEAQAWIKTAEERDRVPTSYRVQRA